MEESIFTVGKHDCIVKVVNDKLVVSFDNGYAVNLTAKPDILEIPITEYDLEVFKDVVYNNESFTWVYKMSNGINTLVNFISEDEYKQRKK